MDDNGRFTFQFGENAVGLERFEIEDLHVGQPEIVQNVEIDSCQAWDLRLVL